MLMACCVANTGSPLWPTVSQQQRPNLDRFSSSVCPLTLDSSNVITLLPRNTAASTPCLPLDRPAVGASLTNTPSIASVTGDVTSLCQTQQQQIDFRSAYGSVTTCFRFATKSSGADFYRLRRLLRRAKSQADATRRDSAKDDGKGDDDDADGCVSRYPQYCIVCRVHLNAQLQAKQHYNGRTHARRVRLLYGAPAITAGTATDPAICTAISSNSDTEVSSVYFGAS